MSYEVILTAVLVSLDACAAGFALSMRGAMNVRNILIIGLLTFLLCAPCALFGDILDNYLGANVMFFGGIILILTGEKNLVESFLKRAAPSLPCGLRSKSTHIGDVVAVGIAVGLDAAIANLSLSIMGNHSMHVPVIFAAMHILAVSIGFLFVSFLKSARYFERAAAIILLGLGVYKIVSYFCGI